MRKICDLKKRLDEFRLHCGEVLLNRKALDFLCWTHLFVTHVTGGRMSWSNSACIT
jgi:hypothetical protein